VSDILLIYNPKAGDANFRFSLDRFIELFSDEKHRQICVFRSTMAGDAEKYVNECDLTFVSSIFIAGGTGTVNEVVNALMKRDIHIPIGVIPAGTENEFAHKLGFVSKELEDNFQALRDMDPIPVDIGCANGQYFVDSFTSGTLNSLSKVSTDAKNTFGSMAYYVMGMTSIRNARRMKLCIETREKRYTGFFSYFAVINTNLMTVPRSSTGQFTLVASKNNSFNGDSHYFNPTYGRTGVVENGVVRLVSDYFHITQLDADEGKAATCIDGDMGPDLPLKITVERGAMEFFQNGRGRAGYNNHK